MINADKSFWRRQSPLANTRWHHKESLGESLTTLGITLIVINTLKKRSNCLFISFFHTVYRHTYPE